MFKQLLRYYHTIKYLKAKQVVGQIYYRTRKKLPQRFRNIQTPLNVKHINSPNIPWQYIVAAKDQLVDVGKLHCLNITADITASHIWNDHQHDKLWLYHLHYFNYVQHCHADMLLRWIKENPPFKGIGFEPYPTARRIVNWIKWLLNHNQDDAKLSSPITTIQTSLFAQVSHLNANIEFHILGNHVFANAKALLFAGIYFNHPVWQKRGSALLQQELREQVLADGGHVELSPMYHAIICEDVLDVIQLMQLYRLEVTSTWQTYVSQLLRWLDALTHLDGKLAHFNDTAHNVACDAHELRHYASVLGLQHEPGATMLTGLLPQSGYCRVQHGTMLLLADVAQVGCRYQPGHAHADTLSFELSIGNKRVFVNSGTSTYREGHQRQVERSTAAHNTLTINGHNSSDVWKSFRVGQRAKVFAVEFKPQWLTAAHNGYAQRDGVIHKRTWEWQTPGVLTITDYLTGQTNHLVDVSVYLHLHPDISATMRDDHCVLLTNAQDHTINIAMVRIQTACSIQLLATTYHPGFNITLANQTIRIVVQQVPPITIVTEVISVNNREHV